MPDTTTDTAADKRAAFLAALATSAGDISAACKSSGVSRATVYRWRDSDVDFAAALDKARSLVSGAGGEPGNDAGAAPPAEGEPAAVADDETSTMPLHANGAGDATVLATLEALETAEGPDLDDLINELEEQIDTLEAEKKKAQAEFPRHALAAQIGPARAEHKAKANALRATLTGNSAKIEELRTIVDEAKKAQELAGDAARVKRKQETVRLVAAVLEECDADAAQLEKMLAELAPVAKRLLQRQRAAWDGTRSLISVDQGYACYPDEKLVSQAILAWLMENDVVTAASIEDLSPIGFAGLYRSPGLRVVVANQKMLMLSRFDLVALEPVKALPQAKPVERAGTGDWLAPTAYDRVSAGAEAA